VCVPGGGAAQFVVLQVFQPHDDLFAALFAADALPGRFVAECGYRFIQHAAIVLVQRVPDDLGLNFRIDVVGRFLLAGVLLVCAAFFQHLFGRLQ
jgi:hypothetical protein